MNIAPVSHIGMDGGGGGRGAVLFVTEGQFSLVLLLSEVKEHDKMATIKKENGKGENLSCI